MNHPLKLKHGKNCISLGPIVDESYDFLKTQKYFLTSLYSFIFLSKGTHLFLNIYPIRYIISKMACFVSYLCPYL